MVRLQPQSVSLAIYFLCNMTFCFVVVIMLAQLYSTPILNQMAFVSKLKMGRGKFSCVCVKTET